MSPQPDPWAALLQSPQAQQRIAEIVQQAVERVLGGDVQGKVDGALRSTGSLLQSSGSLAERLEKVEQRIAQAQREHASPVMLPPTSSTQSQRAQVDEMLAKADATTDPALREGYRARAEQLRASMQHQPRSAR